MANSKRVVGLTHLELQALRAAAHTGGKVAELAGAMADAVEELESKLVAMTGATSSAEGKTGLVPAPAAGKQASFLRGDGTWVVPTNTTYSNFVKSGSGAKAGLVPAPSTTAGTTKYLREDGTWQVPPDNNTTYTAATAAPLAAGTAAVGTSAKYAREDHVHPAQTTVSGNAGSATKLATARTIDGVSFNGSAAITHYGTCSTAAATVAKTVALTGFTLVTGAKVAVRFTVTNTGAVASLTLNVNGTGAKAIKYRNGNLPSAGTLAAGRTYEFVYDGTYWQLMGDLDTDTNTTYSAMTGASASAAGKAGLVPAPAAGKQASFLRGDGTWVVPANTTYSNMTGATTSAAGKAGLVPAPAAGAATRFLRSDGTWQVPPDTNTVYTHPAYTARTGKPTANQTPAFGGTVTISQITSDAAGHVTGMTDRTIKIPNTAASASTAGLMSAADKMSHDALVALGLGVDSGGFYVTV